MTIFEEKHGRPKPPRIMAEGRLKYERLHQVIVVYRGEPGQWLVDSYKDGDVLGEFPTHAEAVKYAHKIVNERTTR